MFIETTQAPCSLWTVLVNTQHFVFVDDNTEEHLMFHVHDMDSDGDKDWEHVADVRIVARGDCPVPIQEQMNIYQRYAMQYVSMMQESA